MTQVILFWFTTIRPFLEARGQQEADMGAASPLSSGSSSVSSPVGGGATDYLEDVLDAVEKYTMIDKVRRIHDIFSCLRTHYI